MGIIGVVVALTIPNLNQSTGDREKVVKVKKIYANLEDAFGRATAVYGPFDEWFTNFGKIENYADFQAVNNRFSGRILEFMKVSKDCGYEDTGCFTSSKLKDLSGKESFPPIDKRPKVLLADGTALLFSKEDSFNQIYIDIDGVKGSNTFGKDIFVFAALKNGIIPSGIRHKNETLITNCFTKGTSCKAWVIETGNMDYLKANEGVCPNGTTLSWENTSCK